MNAARSGTRNTKESDIDLRLNTTRLLALALATGLVACGDPGEVATGDELLEPVPSTSQLALTMDDGAAEAPDEAPANGPSKLRAATAKILDRVNAAIATTQDRLHSIADGVEPETTTIAGFDCKRWTKAGDVVEWRLTACELPGPAMSEPAAE